MRRAAAMLATLALILTLVPTAALAAPSSTGTWIVTLREDVDPSAAAPDLARRHGGQVGYVYEQALNGFSFRGSQAAATALLRNPGVLTVEADAEVWLDETQSSATWGLDRIDQRDLPLDTTYTYDADGTGVTAYVIDSGIHYDHSEFGGRAKLGADIVGGITPAGSDCNGHGTHVAGTIGGSTYGVAKDVTLVSVRVFGCSGGSTWEVIIAGIDWVITDHDPGEPAVANMSLGGGGNSSVDTATSNLIADGVATAVAAGNGNWVGRQADACNYSPARVPEAMTVSATDSSDRKASWANYGDCVDWFAPGVSITSAWHTGNDATNTISGTSMASPHTAGVAALYLEGNSGASPDTVRTAIYDATTQGVVSKSSTVNNHLLYSLLPGGGGGSGPDPDPPGDDLPTASLTSPAADAIVSGIVTLTASASDDVGVVKVEFFHGTTLIGTDESSTDGWSVEWETTAVADGNYTLTAIATDTAGQTTTSAAVTVTVSNSPGGGGDDDGTYSVTLSSASTNEGSSWTSTVTFTATDSAGNAVADVEVSGTWSNGGSDSCTTGPSGWCSVERSQHKKVGSVTFTVTGASHETLRYDGNNGSLTISKP